MAEKGGLTEIVNVHLDTVRPRARQGAEEASINVHSILVRHLCKFIATRTDDDRICSCLCKVYTHVSAFNCENIDIKVRAQLGE